MPQLIRPVVYDQFDNSARTTELGVGRELLVKQYTPQNVAKALAALTADPETMRHCREVSKHFKGHGGIASAADTIEKPCLPPKLKNLSALQAGDQDSLRLSPALARHLSKTAKSVSGCTGLATKSFMPAAKQRS